MRHLPLSLVAFLFLASTATAAPPKQPNIVLILADDLGAFDLACDGRTDHRTPNLDKLAAAGARFTAAYAAASICSPTRAALMTGLSPARLHLTTFLPGRGDAPSQKLLHPTIATHLPANTATLPGLLKEAGYATGCFGKWHLGGKGHLPTDHGFDEFYPGQANTTPSVDEGGKGEFGLTAAAGAFAEKNKDRPFFVYLAHNAPHIPYTARPDRVKTNAAAFEPTYAAVVESLDASVGQLLQTLDNLGVADRTIVIFTSDNGGLHVPELKHERVTHNGRLRAGKGFLYEGGLRVPLIVRWPGTVKPGMVISTPVQTADWLPTLLEIAGRKVPAGLDGVSFGGQLTGGEVPVPRSLYWHQPHYTNQGGRPGSAIRDGNWKLIEWAEDDSAELFDLTTDPGETTDLAAKYPDRVKTLRAKLATWRTGLGAQTMSPNPAFDTTKHRALYIDPDPSKFAPATASPVTFEAMRAWRKRTDAAVAAQR
ncbi:sulfatase [Fimbriiglobus ruber]|uniref:Choline-sulfatase n=1 Tax=Fimbriiglobus ruber TaxID=1908690 RepID=A0A225E6B4_9BACT|nr:sulfatase [Fimbriiglobus ruber]OWK46348.1 Choline-sulfatase [Fimbriiglobus ruber]